MTIIHVKMEVDYSQSHSHVYFDIQGFKMSENRLISNEFCLLDDNRYEFHALAIKK